MVVKGKEFDEIYDLVGVRVLVDSVKDCWAALGAIHGAWTPVPGPVQGLHQHPQVQPLPVPAHHRRRARRARPLEAQIRTVEMHNRAEWGIAAHWGYKEKASAADVAWLQRIVDWSAESTDPAEFLETLKLDLETDEVFVFTPKGDVVSLPIHSTPIDFAYAIHTEVGHRCIGARVNGRLVPLDSQLASGDSVEIFTSKVPSAGPSRDWLKIVVSPRARNKIRQWFSRERREDAIESGRDELAKALRKEGLPGPEADQLAGAGRGGRGHQLRRPRRPARRHRREPRVGPVHRPAGGPRAPRRRARGAAAEHRPPAPPGQPAARASASTSRASTTSWSGCPGAAPRCRATRSSASSPGAAGSACTAATAPTPPPCPPARWAGMIEVEWDRGSTGSFVAAVELKALDRTRLGVDVWKVISDNHLNILRSDSLTGADRVSRMRFEFELADPAHLDSLLTPSSASTASTTPTGSCPNRGN